MAVDEQFFSFFFVAACCLIASLCGLCVLAIAIKGKTAALLLGSGVLLCGVLVMIGLSFQLPRYWWAGLFPSFIGVQALRAWKRPPKSSFRISLSTLVQLVLFCSLLFAGMGQLVLQKRREAALVAQLSSIVNVSVVESFDGIATGVILQDVENGSAGRDSGCFGSATKPTAVPIHARGPVD